MVDQLRITVTNLKKLGKEDHPMLSSIIALLLESNANITKKTYLMVDLSSKATKAIKSRPIALAWRMPDIGILIINTGNNNIKNAVLFCWR